MWKLSALSSCRVLCWILYGYRLRMIQITKQFYKSSSLSLNYTYTEFITWSSSVSLNYTRTEFTTWSSSLSLNYTCTAFTICWCCELCIGIELYIVQVFKAPMPWMSLLMSVTWIFFYISSGFQDSSVRYNF